MLILWSVVEDIWRVRMGLFMLMSMILLVGFVVCEMILLGCVWRSVVYGIYVDGILNIVFNIGIFKINIYFFNFFFINF